MVQELQQDSTWSDLEFEAAMHGENLVARKIDDHDDRWPTGKNPGETGRE
jgi:hypothetical protein